MDNFNNVIFHTTDDYLMFLTDKFNFLTDVAKAENEKTEIAHEDFISRLNSSVERYKESNKKMKKCLLLTTEQLDELIEQAVTDKLYNKALLKKLEITKPYVADVIKPHKPKIIKPKKEL